jgi:hypothetical protein
MRPCGSLRRLSVGPLLAALSVAAVYLASTAFANFENPKPGSWSGTTLQGNRSSKLTFSLKRERNFPGQDYEIHLYVRRLALFRGPECPQSSRRVIFVRQAFHGLVVINGSFQALRDVSPYVSDSWLIAGSFVAARRARGVLEVEDHRPVRLYQDCTYSSGDVRWKARHR